MPIICLEGASAVGKTILSAYLRDNFNSYVIPEVNFLFERKEDESKFWYFEKQVERWQMAVDAAKNHKIAILDGDPFQPLWYNWSFDYDFGEPLETIADFYETNLAAGEIDFPGKYFILSVNREELEQRKIADAPRSRKNFDRHLSFIKPQLAYFNFIKSVNDNLVEFIENKEIEKTGKKIMNSIEENFISNNPSSLLMFTSIKNWLDTNPAEKFKSY